MENENGGWITLLEEVQDPDNSRTMRELPLFKGFIHEATTVPFYVQQKDKEGNKSYATYDEGHIDAGKFVIADKYKALLGASENGDIAVSDFLSRQELVDLAEVNIAKQEYKVGGKAYSILDLNDTGEVVEGETI